MRMESEVEHELNAIHNNTLLDGSGSGGAVDGTVTGVGVDAATLVSVGSSCVILVSGCIAVACLVAYMRNMKRHASEARVASHCGRACVKCAQQSERRVTKASLPVTRTPITADPYATRHLLFDNEKSFCGLVSEMKTREDDNDNVSDGHGLVSSPPPDYRRVVVVRDDSSGVLYKTQSQSAITSCSSNHEELVGAYEFGRKQQQQQTALQTILSEQKCIINDNIIIDDNITNTTAHSSPLTLTPDDDNNSTDSGIRQFTSRAANPFEIREASSVVVSARRREHPFGAITRHRSRRPSWSLSTTMKSSTRLTDETDVTPRDASSSPPFGLSSDDEDMVEYEYHPHISDDDNRDASGDCVVSDPSSAAPSTVSTPSSTSSSSTSSLSSTISSSFKLNSELNRKSKSSLYRIDC